jgi:ribosome maturation protein Sdo1
MKISHLAKGQKHLLKIVVRLVRIIQLLKMEQKRIVLKLGMKSNPTQHQVLQKRGSIREKERKRGQQRNFDDHLTDSSMG